MSTISPYLDDVETVFESLRELQQGWPVSLYLRSGMETPPSRDFSSYVANPSAFPWTLRDAFPTVPDEKVGSLATACALLFHVVIACDNWMDASSRFNSSADPIRVQALSFEGYRLLGALFPANCVFWSRFERYMHEFVSACALERRAVDEGFPWPSLDERHIRDLVTGRNALARIVVAGLVEMSGEERLYEPLIASVDRFMFGFQMVDDVQDWREDLQCAAPSLLLLQCARAHPEAIQERLVGAKLFHDGLIEEILSEGIAQYDGALSVLEDIDCPKWRGLLACKRAEVDETLRDVGASIRRTLETARRRRKVEPSFDASPATCRLLDELLAQWRGGYGEATHLLRATRDREARDTVVRGDVFGRTFFLEAFLDAVAAGAAGLEEVVTGEIDFMASCANRDQDDGWRYFTDLDELPPDAETLGRALEVLIRSRGRAFAAPFVERPLNVLLRQCPPVDGALPTWIIPSGGRSELQERQAAYAERHLSADADVVVTATILHALNLYDPERYRETIRRGARYVLAARGPQGLWSSMRYRGPFYPTYACSRFIAAVAGGRDDCASPLTALQRDDGGWGLEGEGSDLLSTGLALLSLTGTSPQTSVAASRAAVEYLERSTLSFPANFELIVPGTRAAPTLISRMESCGSRTMAVAFALRALIAARIPAESLV